MVSLLEAEIVTKPRIRKYYGVWCCGLPKDYWGYVVIVPPLGHGYTPGEAYADWKAQQ